MIDYLKNYLNTQTINDYEKAEIILSVIFSIFNFIVIILTLTLFDSNNKNVSNLCYQLVGIFFVDIITRLYHIYLLQKNNSSVFIKQVISCIFGVDLFYLTLSLFIQVSKMLKVKEKIEIVLPCLLYVLCFFSYDKIISFNPITFSSFTISFGSLVLLTQSLFCIIFFYYVLDMIRPAVNSIASIIAKGHKTPSPVHKFIVGAPFSILYLFIVHYLMKIILLFFDSPLVLLYGTIATNIFKNGAKYFVLFSCEIILYAIRDLVIQENTKKNDSEEIQIMNM
jgi:hypothetical protein